MKRRLAAAALLLASAAASAQTEAEIRKKAEAGNAEAQFAMSERYGGARKLYWAFQAAGRGHLTAFGVLEGLAARGDPKSQMALALVLDPPPDLRKSGRRGNPGTNRKARSLKLYRGAAEKGYPPAQTCYAQYLCKEPAEATRWLVKAAEKGHSEALIALYSRFMAKDPESSEAFLRGAADAGHPLAQMVLAMKIRERDPLRAAALLRAPAEAGLPEAQGALGSMIAMGEAGKKDMVEAYRWAYLAARENDAARELLTRMAEEMYAKEIDEAVKRAQPLMKVSYRPHHVCYDASLEVEPAL